ncbi:hypothetical protein JCM30237_10170 [Halolamina litorea]|uniref:PH domain-containing protein n=1 Tax=Halolamina litorea TaxID=1515593 RepID=A0ABD6BVR6_9EURY|nr:hypothetical protein [Halolamina litorea]
MAIETVEGTEPVDDTDQPVSLTWRVSPEGNRWLHLLAYGLLAPVGAVATGLAVGGVIAVVALALEGSWGPVFLLALAVAVAFSRPPVLAAIRSDETSASFGYEGWQPSRVGLLTASVLCGGAMLLASLHSRVATVSVGVVSFAAGLLAITLHTDASIDAEGRLQKQQATAVDLRTLSRVRSVDLFGVTAFWLSYARGADSFRNPRVLSVPHDRAAEVREALDAGVDADSGADPIGRTERVVVGLVGLGVLATGPALWLLVGDAGADEAVVLVYPAAMSLVFAGPMFWYAWKG